MRVLFARNGIEYGCFDHTTLEGAIDCVSETFARREPMSRHLGITKEEFLVLARAIYPSIAEEGLSFVARNAKTGEIVGVRISEDFVQDQEMPEIKGLSPKFFPIFRALGQLSERFRTMRKPKKGQYVHLFMVAVRDGYTGQGVAPSMNRLFFQKVKERGYTHAVTEPSGVISQYLLVQKFGFNPLDSLRYADFEFEGKKVFADLRGHEGILLLEKNLAELIV